jgi:hypothetical protein
LPINPFLPQQLLIKITLSQVSFWFLDNTVDAEEQAFSQGLKPRVDLVQCGTTKVVP